MNEHFPIKIIMASRKFCCVLIVNFNFLTIWLTTLILLILPVLCSLKNNNIHGEIISNKIHDEIVVFCSLINNKIHDEIVVLCSLINNKIHDEIVVLCSLINNKIHNEIVVLCCHINNKIRDEIVVSCSLINKKMKLWFMQPYKQ